MQAIKDEFICTICQEISNIPVKNIITCDKCHYNICFNCSISLFQLFKKGIHRDHSVKCIICRANETKIFLKYLKFCHLKPDISRMKILDATGHTSECNLIKYNRNTYEVEDKCSFKGTPSEVWRHVRDECDFMFIKCSHNECRQFGQRCFIKKHELNCPYNLILCNHCGLKFTPLGMKNHYIKIFESFTNGIFKKIYDMDLFLKTLEPKYLTHQEYVNENIGNLSIIFNDCINRLQKKLNVPFQLTESEVKLFS